MDQQSMAKHKRVKLILRILGAIILVIGIVFLVLGFIKFSGIASGDISATDGFLYEFFISFPLLFVGGSCLIFGFAGSMQRYMSREVTPVAKDAANYMIKGTKDSIVDVVKEIKNDKPQIVCPKCGALNDSDQNFCGKCGTNLK